MEKYIEQYSKVGQGAWTAKAFYDEAVTSLLNQQFDNLEGFLEIFYLICGEFGGEAAARKLQKAANLLLNYGQQQEMSERCLKIAASIRFNPQVASCIDLNNVETTMNSHHTISSRVEEICEFLGCYKNNLNDNLKREVESDTIPSDWSLQVSSLYTRAYDEWFTEVADRYLKDYLPSRETLYASPKLRVADWSSEVWRCWRFLDCPTLVDPGIFRPSQFFVWHIIHDSVHIWQMQAYDKKWSNILAPNEFLFLEAQAMSVEIILLNLMKESYIEIPQWYPSSQKSIIIRLLIGLLEREIRLNLDLKVHLHGQNFTTWLDDISRLTNLSPEFFQGLTAELLGMPGFCAAYTVVTDKFKNLSHEQRKMLLQNFPHITYESLGTTYFP
ncbi:MULTISPECIES: hypothetical protein [unclassified Microcoleus]|uniref:hypothetical protein n=1 Tax=unclassified Microcoleus TaxID=2642155 RepID=UPI001E02F191|nr:MULTISPECIES: hypothetical protein [unclassified Microcoleus]MCC3429559.1 hypothetical protein [Microcoleus sp. PH2017_04_SCI_O_A]MCC3465268.1 hypothetical protein [Microcoleus sp. PH2017_06_SFM_O_A]TAF86894.1 MAG: hypothetical protein EAZ49_21770 [Oscillatoriales cyanobacterium]MCC3410284.1 hypothetical protein [Microcoleus sp. PH2017_02_FOX_O_A]MCC3422749.1 hypothetical protein [Microcoleus sp. PH2017_01_SCD_O_A]